MMGIQEILAALLNPNGVQQNQLSMAGAPAQVGDHANPALLRQAQQALAPQMPQQAPPQMAPQAFAPPQAPQDQPMPQSAPQAAPGPAPAPAMASPGGGGIGGFLSGLLQGPKAAEKNHTINWLQKQGLDQGTATLLAGSKPELQQYLLSRSQGKKPIEVNGRLIDPDTFEVLADFSTPGSRQTTTIDGKLVDTNTGQVIGDYGADKKTRDLTPEEVERRGYAPGVYQEDAEGNVKVVGGVRDQDAGFKNEMELRKEYDMLPEVKDYKIVRSNYERIQKGVQLGTGAGDAAIIFGYMKMLDPTSVVREGEQATASNAAGVPEAVRGMWNQVKGGGTLSAEARQQILDAAEKVYGESATNIEDVNKRYGGYAGAWKLDPTRITSPTEQYAPLAQPATDGGLPLPPPQVAPMAPTSPSEPSPQRFGDPTQGVIDWQDWFKKRGR